MEYKYITQRHLKAKDFCIDPTSNDLVRGHCMWGGSDQPSHDWCGVKVHNKKASGRRQRETNGVIEGKLYGFAVLQGMDEGKELRPESYSTPFWVCKDHDAEFHDLHRDWGHTIVTFAIPNGNVYAMEEIPEQMFEVSFRYFDANGNADAEHVSEQVTYALNGLTSDTERWEYLKVIG